MTALESAMSLAPRSHERALAGAASIRAHRIAYCGIEDGLLDRSHSFARRAAELGGIIGQQVNRALSGIDRSLVADCVLCSTTAPATLTEGEPGGAFFRCAIGESCGLSPSMIVSAYECATWGYMLRYFARDRGRGFVLLVVMDVNLHGFRYWSHRSAWGKSGFGCALVLLELRWPPGEDLLVAHAASANTVFEFARSVRVLADRCDDITVFLPFFLQPSRGVLDRVFANRRAPDYHAIHGHCFGSDPWIAVIRSLTARPALAGQEAIVASLSLHGYFCAARIVLPGPESVALSVAERAGDGFSLVEVA